MESEIRVRVQMSIASVSGSVGVVASRKKAMKGNEGKTGGDPLESILCDSLSTLLLK